MKPYNKLSWIFLILLLPFVGCPCYFLFGRSEMTKKNRVQIAQLQRLVEPMRTEQEEVNEYLKQTDSIAYKQMMFSQKIGSYPAYMEDETNYYNVGDDMFVDMINDIKNANTNIHKIISHSQNKPITQTRIPSPIPNAPLVTILIMSPSCNS